MIKMKIACGTDIIEISRIERSMKKYEKKYKNKIFTDNEIEYCENKGSMKYQHYAVRFAAKEAIFKAVSNLLKDKYELGWKNIEINNDINDRPFVKFININMKLIRDIDISLSHCKEYAIANVVLIYDNIMEEN